MIRVVLAKTLTTLLVATLSERFILNVLTLLAGWAVKRWGNDLADELFAEFKKSLDRDHGQAMNLYEEIRRDAGR